MTRQRSGTKTYSLLQVSAETLFGTIPKLIRAHRSFWEEGLQPVLEETRTSGQPLDPVSLQNGFLTVSMGIPRKGRMKSAQKDPRGTKYNSKIQPHLLHSGFQRFFALSGVSYDMKICLPWGWRGVFSSAVQSCICFPFSFFSLFLFFFYRVWQCCPG